MGLVKRFFYFLHTLMCPADCPQCGGPCIIDEHEDPNCHRCAEGHEWRDQLSNSH
jgi:hypothetical protein